MYKNNFVRLIILLIIAFSLSACVSSGQVGNEKETLEKAKKVEVVYFYGSQRCFACIKMGELSRVVVYEFFQAQLRDGEIEYKEINVELPENREIVNKFKARGSSLYINAIYEETNVIEEDVTVWRFLSNEDQFKNYLKNKLNNLLDI